MCLCFYYPLQSSFSSQLLLAVQLCFRPCLLGSVRVENITDCQVYLGPCCTSAYLESCKSKHSSHDLDIYYFPPRLTFPGHVTFAIIWVCSCVDCVIFTSSHQLRIHACVECDLYVRVNSHPIIEDCTDMRFSPYIIMYGGIESDFKVHDLRSLINLINQFNLLVIMKVFFWSWLR